MKNENPTEFSFEKQITRSDLLKLSKENSDIDKQCFWLPDQAFCEGINLKDDSSFDNAKFDNPYTFPKFSDWLYWSNSWEELQKAVSFSELFGVSIILCLNDDNIKEYKGKKYFAQSEQPATSIKSFYAFVNDSGYWIEKFDDDGNPEIYKIQIAWRTSDQNGFVIENALNVKKNAVTIYYVHASRVVRFPAFQKDLSYAGTPKAFLSYWISRAKQIYFESVVNGIKNMSGGTIVRRVASESEKDEIEAIDTEHNYQNRIYIYDRGVPLGDMVQVFVPDFKSAQFVDFITEINKYVAQASNLSLRVYGEEDIGSGLGEGGANFSTNLIRSQIRNIQSHYQQYIEHVFYKLGREETSFDWNEPEEYTEEEEKSDRNTQSEGQE
jgi:hypothetical protein